MQRTVDQATYSTQLLRSLTGKFAVMPVSTALTYSSSLVRSSASGESCLYNVWITFIQNTKFTSIEECIYSSVLTCMWTLVNVIYSVFRYNNDQTLDDRLVKEGCIVHILEPDLQQDKSVKAFHMHTHDPMSGWGIIFTYIHWINTIYFTYI